MNMIGRPLPSSAVLAIPVFQVQNCCDRQILEQNPANDASVSCIGGIGNNAEEGPESGKREELTNRSACRRRACYKPLSVLHKRRFSKDRRPRVSETAAR